MYTFTFALRLAFPNPITYLPENPPPHASFSPKEGPPLLERANAKPFARKANRMPAPAPLAKTPAAPARYRLQCDGGV